MVCVCVVLVGPARIAARSFSNQARSRLLRLRLAPVVIVLAVEVAAVVAEHQVSAELAAISVVVTMTMVTAETMTQMQHFSLQRPQQPQDLKANLASSRRWSFRKPRMESFVAKVVFVRAMDHATRSLQNVTVSSASLEKCAKCSTVPDSIRRTRNVAGMVFARWVSAHVLLVGAWHHSEASRDRDPTSAWTRCVLLVAACMASASKENAFVNKVGRDPIAKIRSVLLIVLVMASALSSQCIAPDNACATMDGEAQLVSEWLCTRSSSDVLTIAREMAYAWMACAPAMLVSQQRIVVMFFVPVGSLVQSAISHAVPTIATAAASA